MVKGSENFTFETIAKLEQALEIQLISIPGFETYEKNVIQASHSVNFEVEKELPTVSKPQNIFI